MKIIILKQNYYYYVNIQKRICISSSYHNFSYYAKSYTLNKYSKNKIINTHKLFFLLKIPKFFKELI